MLIDILLYGGGILAGARFGPVLLPKLETLKRFVPSKRLSGDISSIDPIQTLIHIAVSRAIKDISKVDIRRADTWKYTDSKVEITVTHSYYFGDDKVGSRSIYVGVIGGACFDEMVTDKKTCKILDSVYFLKKDYDNARKKAAAQQKALDAISFLTVGEAPKKCSRCGTEKASSHEAGMCCLGNKVKPSLESLLTPVALV